MTWRKVPGGWRRADGRFLPRIPKTRSRRNVDAAAAMRGESLARTVRCSCGWSMRARDLVTANEYWWTHEAEMAYARDGRAHRVEYTEPGDAGGERPASEEGAP